MWGIDTLFSNLFTEAALVVSGYCCFCILTYLLVCNTLRQAIGRRHFRPFLVAFSVAVASVPGVNALAFITAFAIQVMYLEHRTHVRRRLGRF